MDCTSVGSANPDIAGIGILVAFIAQSLIAVILSWYTWLLSVVIDRKQRGVDPPNFLRILPNWITGGHKTTAALGATPEEPSDKTKIDPAVLRLNIANRVLLAGNDSQTFIGLALLISALAQCQSMSLYHTHIVYDTLSLVVVSTCAASGCIFSDSNAKGYVRAGFAALWAVLFVSYVAGLFTRLQRWDNSAATHCYHATKVTLPNASHPYVDNIYVGVTFAFICLAWIYACIIAAQTHPRWNKKLQSYLTGVKNLGDTQMRRMITSRAGGLVSLIITHDFEAAVAFEKTAVQQTILNIAMLQSPLHIYSIFALRASNEHYLEAGDSERVWGFGQIAALVLVGASLFPVFDGIIDLRQASPADGSPVIISMSEIQTAADVQP